MTAPVLTMITPGQGPACENNFTMSFFMSPEVKTPPSPTEKGVFPQDMPQMKVYVRYEKHCMGLHQLYFTFEIHC